MRHATHSVSESLPELNVLSGALPPDALLATEEARMGLGLGLGLEEEHIGEL